MLTAPSPPPNAPLASALAPDPFKGYLDYSFDPVFKDLRLGWFPWVGSGFSASACRTIILGESIYLYKTAAGLEKDRARIEAPDSLRKRHLTHGIEAKFKSRYVRNFERAVFQKVKPNRGEREKLWTEVIYHNLAPKLLGELSHRPTYEHYQDGWRAFLKLVPAVGATHCIAYGHEKVKVRALLSVLKDHPEVELLEKLSLPVVGRKAVPVAVSLRIASQQLDILFIGHPSRAFSWKKWGAVMREQGMLLGPPAAAAVPGA
ncbi:hypothetical protein [Variovorax sp. Sphag1AA]|uniref:hypothetical protein n=1 Tax=Variovorax sp. Sphag1AA TaxID=2587027 RepID=UPI00161D5877|nr:hypothetical protein [Variovorax sp. Sphag1AA]MBB3182284.1 hypothetical protein [Variovorax sp. Sphag1AA]